MQKTNPYKGPRKHYQAEGFGLKVVKLILILIFDGYTSSFCQKTKLRI
jgi:hypothetical protein